jgi:hypothetical protein
MLVNPEKHPNVKGHGPAVHRLAGLCSGQKAPRTIRSREQIFDPNAGDATREALRIVAFGAPGIRIEPQLANEAPKQRGYPVSWQRRDGVEPQLAPARYYRFGCYGPLVREDRSSIDFAI